VTRSDIRRRLGLRPIINVSGTMTTLGASIAVPEAVRAAAEVLPEFVEITDLHRKASPVIARLTGSEAGFVTACASAGITLSVAATMTGADLVRIEQLPDTTGMKNEVVIQAGHFVNYGAPIDQAIRLTGAKVVSVGYATDVRPYQLEAAINERTAAAVYVVSHHVVRYGQVALPEFVAICHRRGVKVIVDAASEYDLKGFLAAGADIAVYSAHKFMGGATAGIVAGRKELVRATFLQNSGIGRGMKVGKESIVATIATLEAWEKRDHAAVRAREDGYLALWQKRFAKLPGITASIEPDPTDNPLSRLKLAVDPAASRNTAWALADALAGGDPPVIVRDHEVEHGFFYLDPCNLHPGEESVVADRVVAECEQALRRNAPPEGTPTERRARRFQRMMAWPD
jgi:L-seryl-tRNA(Ser) seleniumtransferase